MGRRVSPLAKSWDRGFLTLAWLENPVNLDSSNRDSDLDSSTTDTDLDLDLNMTDLDLNLSSGDLRLNLHLRSIISGLERHCKKKTFVGVFGKTGSGKSSLINAILGEKMLLPSGTICACTSVIIQVEANMTNSSYIAEIDFISKKDWEGELKSILRILSDDKEERNDDLVSASKDKLIALYGEDAEMEDFDELIKDDHFSDIPEFLMSCTKTLSFDTAAELFDATGCYIQHDELKPGECFWPVVKCVTIKVPNCKDTLEHITLLDLPGTGDYNKSRDEMWKKSLPNCSSVWLVSEINRAGSEKAAWDILNSSLTDLAQGGECTSITFICTKSDDLDTQYYMRSCKLKDEDLGIPSDQDSKYMVKKKRACILHRNDKAKNLVRQRFEKQCQIKKHFSDENFQVFTVSSAEFTEDNSLLKPEETEIPHLRELLRSLNMRYTKEATKHYFDGALGVLSLIQAYGDNSRVMTQDKSILYNVLDKKLQNELEGIQEYLHHLLSELDLCLSEGVIESEEKSIDLAVKKVIAPTRKNGSAYHRTLKALCRNEGYFRSKQGETDLNQCLATYLYKHINNKFNLYFGICGKTGQSVYERIDEFSIISSKTTEDYGDSAVLNHILNFLKSEETKLKDQLKLSVVVQKKKMYAVLRDSLRNSMISCYRDAALFVGVGSMKKMQDTLIEHIESSKGTMFRHAKNEMLELFKTLMVRIENELRTELKKAMDQSLIDSNTLHDLNVSKEIQDVKMLSDAVLNQSQI
ncbi:nuclear GTPase SLIP-GC-like [Chanos chanos]|uniref:Nuclear GTPase SLIP-GC-like n=1 Tax=Chanos chanos TaxID=29144 RepID=A0A6J2WPM7_CHACN|nr:nuclear GTPase SLIP-GC-like [Chanos chanos]